MTRFRRIIFLILSVLLMASLVACDDSQSGDTAEESYMFYYFDENGSVTPQSEFPTVSGLFESRETTDETTVTTMVTETEVITTEPPHVHVFRDATCTAPETCSCGATSGEALGHSWRDATCTDPKTCTVCGTTSGLTAGHSFYNGNCTSCGMTDPDYVQQEMVWIPTNGGTKYHNNAGCSNMEDPAYVTKSYALSQGFEACKRCH